MKLRSLQAKGNVQKKVIKNIPQKDIFRKTINNQVSKQVNKTSSKEVNKYIPKLSEQAKLRQRDATERRFNKLLQDINKRIYKPKNK